MPSDQFEVNTVWATSSPVATTVDLKVPSGQTCRAKRLGLEGIIEAGLLEDADSLTAFVDQRHVKRGQAGGQEQPEIDVTAIMKDPKQLGKIVMLVDRAMPHIVAEPSVELHFTTDDKTKETLKILPEDRLPGVVYTDQIGLEDKMFLFQWSIGGTGDIEQFRKESSDGVAGVADVQGLPRAARRAAGNRRKSPA